ncbi:polysaccharide biosynthesis/export family protein [Novosphingobium sediminicola]|uniref:Polysaccharide export outer membrane protein n=1 Tax=Novosphingobium sediminicola TaxID=563162 RepID=A0A7W6CI03_9SPHN|nr:polysaccharide export outer membrane protein [Novosphingobium sediminicola]
MKKANLLGLGLCLLLSPQMEAAANAKVSAISSGDRYVDGQKVVESYKLGAGDKVKVTVFNELQLSGEYQVGADGSIALPLVGNVLVLGKTPAEVAGDYEQLLGRDFLRYPRVSVEVSQYRPFFIVGQVRLPGQYIYSAGLTVWNAVAVAQGLTPRGRDSYVFIRKYGEAKEERYRLTPDLRVWPGDTIRVAERFF